MSSDPAPSPARRRPYRRLSPDARREELITVAFLVVTAGGLGSVGGTILAALVIGEAGSLGLLAVGKYSDVLAISLMAAVFVVFPAGIFGGWRRA